MNNAGDWNPSVHEAVEPIHTSVAANGRPYRDYVCRRAAPVNCLGVSYPSRLRRFC